MAAPTLPPRAYTRETLAQAYTWVQSQNDAVKKLATNPDALVALFQRYQRHGDLGLGNREGKPGVTLSPAAQTFQQDMRGWASDYEQGELGAASDEEMIPFAPTAEPVVSAQANARAQQATNNSISIHLSGLAAASPPPPPAEIPKSTELPPAPPAPTQDELQKILDPTSWETVHRVQRSMNLSSPLEACRLLIQQGHERLKSVL